MEQEPAMVQPQVSVLVKPQVTGSASGSCFSRKKLMNLDCTLLCTLELKSAYRFEIDLDWGGREGLEKENTVSEPNSMFSFPKLVAIAG